MDFSDSFGLLLYFEVLLLIYKFYEKIGYEILEDKIVYSFEVMGMDILIEVLLMVKMFWVVGGMIFKDWRVVGYLVFGKVQEGGKVVSVVELKSSVMWDIIVIEVQEVKV